jgi:antitoxin VapB
MAEARRVRLFRNGRNQAVRIPVEFELPGTEAILRQEGGSLIIEPVDRPSLLSVLDSLEPIPEEFPDVDEGLPPLRDINL